MKIWLVVSVPLFLCTSLMPNTSKGQDNSEDSLFFKSAVDNAIAFYHNTIKEQNGLLNGRMNVPYAFPFEGGNPFFGTEKFINGDVNYDGLLYRNVPLLFDQLSNYLIMLTRQGRLELIDEKIESFNISGHQFFRFINDSSNNLSTGFYEQLYDGKSRVILKVKKVIREDLMSGTGVVRYIDQKDYYYIKKDSSYYAVKSKKDVYKIFALHKQQLQQLVKKNNLNFKKDMANSIVQVAGYYDQLTR